MKKGRNMCQCDSCIKLYKEQEIEEKKCTGNCRNICKAHDGEYSECDNPGCICHGMARELERKYAPKTNEKEWEYIFEILYNNAADARERYLSTTNHIDEVTEKEQMIRKRDELYDFVRQLEASTIARCAEVARNNKRGHGNNHPHIDDLNFMAYTPCGIYNKASEDIAAAITSINKTI